MEKRRPTHPGKILSKEYLIPGNIQVKVFAEHIGIHRNTLSEFIAWSYSSFYTNGPEVKSCT